MTTSTPDKLQKNPLIRLLLTTVGILSTALGILGIFLPVLPTTPFLLLAAACFLRSSPACHQWLLGHPHLGRYIHYYLDGKGIPRKAKIYTLIVLWLSISVSIMMVPLWPVRLLLVVIASCVSIYIIRQKTLEPPSIPEKSS